MGSRDKDISTSWLQEFDDTQESRDLDRAVHELSQQERLQEDADLVMWLALNEFKGPAYDRFRLELTKYGLAVMNSWIRSGFIFPRCQDRGVGGLPSPPDGALRDRDTASSLAGETVASALHVFRENALKGKQWNAAGGASLRTFFIGQCLFRFANIYRAWHKDELHRRNMDLTDDFAIVVPHHDGSIVDKASARREVEELFNGISKPKVKAALYLLGAGWQQHEIAEHLGMSTKAVERMWQYYRTKMKASVAR